MPTPFRRIKEVLSRQLRQRRGRAQRGEPARRFRWLCLERFEGRTLLSVTPLLGRYDDYSPPRLELHEPGGYLTEPSNKAPLDIARDYLAAQSATWGFTPEDFETARVTDQFTSASTALTHVFLRQTRDGLEIANANLHVAVTADGRVLSVDGGFVPGLDRSTPSQPPPGPTVSAAAALFTGARELGLEAESFITFQGPLRPADRELLISQAVASGAIASDTRYVATPEGLRSTWDFSLDASGVGYAYRMHVDAFSGSNLVVQDLRRSVLEEWLQGDLTAPRPPFAAGPSPYSYEVDGRTIAIEPSADQLVVDLTGTTLEALRGSLPTAHAAAIDWSVSGLLDGRTALLRAAHNASEFDLAAALAAAGRTSWSGPLFRDPVGGATLFPNNELIVSLHRGIAPEEVFSGAFANYRRLRGTTDQFVATVAAVTTFDTLAAADALRSDPRVAWVTPEFFVQVQTQLEPNDPLFNSHPTNQWPQWHLHNTGQLGNKNDADADLPEAWGIETGNTTPIVIAVLDDGVDLSHPDLNIFTNPGEVPGNGIDDDGNGWIDDVHGWDFHNDDSDPSPIVPSDNHGTAVAGVAAAIGNNGSGGAGASWMAQILPVKIARDDLDGLGGFAKSAQIAEAIYYAAGRKESGSGTWKAADVLNNSWRQSAASSTVTSAFTWAAQQGRDGKGAVSVAAAGNDASGYRPFEYEEFPAGTWVFEWRYTKNASGTAGGDTAWLANVHLPDGTVERFDATGLPSGWTTSGDASWSVVDDPVHAYGTGRYQAKAGTIGDNQTTKLRSKSVTATGTKPLRYSAWVSSDSGDELTLWVSSDGGSSFQGPIFSQDGNHPVTTSVSYPASLSSSGTSTLAIALAVGASTDWDYRADYSQYGSALDVVAPSSGGFAAITTTDRQGEAGYNQTGTSETTGPDPLPHIDYTSTFGGTSSATPLVSGIVALMLSRNPTLTAVEVRDKLRASADKIGGVTYPNNFNQYYGYGRVNAKAALDLVDPTPEIDVRGNGKSIAKSDESDTADTADHTDFGSTFVGGDPISRTFTIANTGSADLNLTGSPRVQLSGTHAGDFAVTTQPASPVAKLTGTTTFTITFDPSATGLRQATVNIANDDANEAPYTFAIAGTGTTIAEPEIEIRGNSVVIVSSDTTPAMADHTDFGSHDVTGGTQSRTFTISNHGSAGLNLTGSERVDLSNDADFSVTTQPSTPVASGGNATSFVIKFDPSTAGLRQSTVTITNNDANEGTFTFTIQGFGFARDFGDAPAPYPTTLVENGPRHQAVGPTLGANRDVETDGSHSAGANGDDTTGSPNDEDGVTFGMLRVGQLGATATVNVQNAPSGAKLDAWIDFNGDGTFSGPGEQIAARKSVVNGNNTLTFAVPSVAKAGTRFARFRLSTAGGLPPVGPAIDGEVEDHAVTIEPPAAGSGTFSAAQNISTTASGATFVTAFDLDRDGDMDVLSANPSEDRIAWYENNGSQVFSEHTIPLTIPNVVTFAVADLDADGDFDIVTGGNHPTDCSEIYWLRNNGSQNFTRVTIPAPTSVTECPAGATSVYALDVDNDGDLDVLTTDQFRGEILLSENNGSQVFTTRLFTNAAAGETALFVSDVDRDGDADLLTASFNDGVIRWFENVAVNGFLPRVVDTAAQGATSVFAADVDGDGDMDLLSAASSTDQIAWYRNNGSQSFTKVEISSAADYASSVFATDLDGDGDIDVVSASRDDDKIVWYKNDGSQSFTANNIASNADGARSVFVADMDRDGDLDVLSASANDNKIAWYPQIGFDFGDAPAPYPTTFSENGARHQATGPTLGPNRDTEPGAHSTNADGDDNDRTPDDEDGVTFTTTTLVATSVAARTAQVQMNLQNADATANRLDAWIDWNRDGDWADAGEQIFTNHGIGTANGVQALNFTIPQKSGSNIVAGASFARFRLSTGGGLAPTGAADNGEVEDHPITIAIDDTAPQLVSIVRQTPTSELTNENSVTFRVTFDENMTNVGAADFSLSGTAAADGTVSSVTAATETRIYDVSITGLTSSNGTVNLNIASGHDLKDLVGNPLTDLVADPDQSYSLDNTLPTTVITFPVHNAAYNAAGWADAISGTASDPTVGSVSAGVAAVAVSLRRLSDNKYWNGSAFASDTEAWLSATGTTTWSRALTDANLANGVSYTIRTQATDNAGNVGNFVSATFTFDTAAPVAPTVTSPAAAVRVNAASFAIAGSAEANALVRVYSDANNNGAIDGADAMVASQQLTAGGTAISILTTLAQDAANNFLVTARDAAGNESLPADIPTITEDSTPPTVQTFAPTDNATGVALGANLAITFSESVQAVAGNITIKRTSNDSTFATIDVTSAAVTLSGATVTIDPPSNFEALTGYYVQIASGAIEDLAGNDFPGITTTTTWDFTTGSQANSAPVLDASGSPVLTAIDEDAASPAGDTVAAIVVNGSITDLDVPVSSHFQEGSTSTGGAGYTTDAVTIREWVSLQNFTGVGNNQNGSDQIFVGFNEPSGDTNYERMRGLLEFDLSALRNSLGASPFVVEDLSLVLRTAATGGGRSGVGTGLTFQLDVYGYGFDVVEGTATWASPASGDATAGGSHSSLLASSPTFNPATTNQTILIAATAAFRQAITAALAGSGILRLLLRSPDAVENPVRATGFDALFARLVAESDATAANRPRLNITLSAPEAVAVTGVDTNGTWEFSTNGGGNWTNFGTPSAAAARLLEPAHLVRFVPTSNFNGTATFTYRAWDQTSGTSGGTADTTTNGGSTAFSTTVETATITVNAINDPPVRTAGTLTPVNVNEDSANSTAATLGLSEVTYGPGGGSDESTQTLAYQVTALPAFIQLFKSDGATQVNVNDTITAAELQGLKYKTMPDANGSGNLTWTVTDSGSGTAPHTNTLAETLAITVNAVNDAPVRTAGALAPISVAEDSANAAAVTLGLAAVTYGPGGGADETSQSLTYTITAVPAQIHVFKADGTTQVNANDAVTASELQGLKYKTLADVNGSGDLTWTVTDSGSGASPHVNTLSETLAITVNPVNDAPLRTAGTSTPIAVAEDSANGTAVTWGLGSFTYGPGGGSDESTQTLTYTITAIPAFVQVFKSDGTTQVNLNDTVTAAELQGLKYKTLADANGSGDLNWTVTDSGSGTAPHVNLLTETLAITVSAINDAPVRTAGTLTPINVNENSANSTAVTLGLAAVTYGPGGGTDEASQTLTYTITAIPAFVQIFKADGTTQVSVSNTVTESELQGLKYKTLADATGAGNLTWTVTDSGSGTSPNVNSLTENLSITVNEAADPLDFGDAPDPSYATLLASNGPRHTVVTGVRLGAAIDAETEAQQNASATGDDDATDDEDGVTLPAALTAGQNATISVTASTAGELALWIDFDANGVFDNASERFAHTYAASGTANLHVAVPANAAIGTAFARFRFSTSAAAVANPTGAAPDGEVEDYAITIQVPAAQGFAVNKANSANSDDGQDLAVDTLGNVYVAGVLDTGALDFGTDGRLYVAKHLPSGQLAWERIIGGIGQDVRARSIAVDATGQVFVTGFVQGTNVDFGGGQTVTKSNESILLWKLNTRGQTQWVHAIGGQTGARDEGLEVAADSSGSVYVSGRFKTNSGQTIDFDPGPGSALRGTGNNSEGFIAKYDASGAFQWVHQAAGSADNQQADALTLGGSGAIYVAGRITSAVDFINPNGSTAASLAMDAASGNTTDSYVLKLDANGAFLWAKRIGGADIDIATAVATDSTENVYVGGLFRSTVDFNQDGTTDASANGVQDPFLIKLNSAGTYQWGEAIGSDASDSTLGSGSDRILGIAVAADGTIHAVGRFTGRADFNPGTGVFALQSAGGEDGFILRLDADGDFQLARRFGSTGEDGARGIAVGTGNSVNIAGTFAGTATLNVGDGSDALTSSGTSDLFVAKILTPGLTLEIAADAVSEAGGPKATTAAVLRTGSLILPLTVSITNPDNTELFLPASVTISSGEAAAQFDIETVNDGDLDGDQTNLVVTANTVTDTLTVADDDTTTVRTLGGHLYGAVSANTYKVLHDITVDAGRTLTISPASTLKFEPATGATVAGTLTAVGASGSQIVFTSGKTTPAPGDWDGIVITAAGQPRTVLDYVEVAYGNDGVAVSSLGTSPQVTISNANIHHHADDGVYVPLGNSFAPRTINANDVLILDSHIHHNNGDGVQVSANSGTSVPVGNPLPSSRNDTSVSGNEIDHNGGAGIRLTASTHPLAGIIGTTSNVGGPISDNFIHSNADGISGATVPGVLLGTFNTRDTSIVEADIFNNLIANNTSRGIVLTTSTSATPRAMRPVIVNNTIVGNGTQGVSHPADVSTGFVLRNNLIASNSQGITATAAYTPAAGVVGYNLLFGNTTANFANYPAVYGTPSTTNANGTPSDAQFNISVDPLFVSSTDRHLFPWSPAVNAGTTTGAPSTDFDSETRSGAIDIGADEVPTLTVTIAADESDAGLGLGAGDSLREVINAANANPGPEVILFDAGLSGGTISLGGTQLPEWSTTASLRGPGADQLTVSGNSQSRVMSVASGAAIELNGLTIANGSASGNAGGVLNSGKLILTESVVTSNQSTTGGGGIFSTGELTLNRSTVSNNTVTTVNSGGGIFVRGVASLRDSTVSGNAAGNQGGGILNDGTLTIINTTISGNAAGFRGGGISNSSVVSTPVLISHNATITNNRSDSGGGSGSGGGIYVAGDVTLHNTIVAGNFKGPETTVNELHGTLNAASSFNLIGHAASAGGLTHGTNGNQVGLDPLLAPLADYGGPTLTHALLNNSPALEAGSNALALDANAAPLATDQRGFVRIVDRDSSGTATVDIGAYEATVPIQVESVVVGDGSASRSTVKQLVVTFNRVVTLYAGAFLINKRGAGGGPVGVAVSADDSSGKTIATLTFTGGYVEGSGSLSDGNYGLEIVASKVRVGSESLDGDDNGAPGGDYPFGYQEVDEFFRLFGDGDGDGDVDATDLFLHFAPAFGSNYPNSNYRSDLDTEQDGDVDATDLFLGFAPNFGITRDTSGF